MKLFFLFIACVLLNSCIFLREVPPPLLKWPLKKYTITQKFLPYKRPPHLGIDLKAPLGTPVLSSHSGRVVYAGYRLTGYGKTIMLEHSSKKWASLYAHLHTIKVKIGQRVSQGQVIGTLGNTGRTSGAHLHFEIMHREKLVNPLSLLP